MIEAFQPGSGVRLGDIKLKPAILRRIERLGRMNDRRVEYLANGDRFALMQLAQEYEDMNMPRMAQWIRADVSK